MKNNIYVYIMVSALVTYAIRVLPLLFMRKNVNSRFIKSFLYYVPYVTLAVMTFPAMIETSQSLLAGIITFLLGVLLAFLGSSLIVTAAGCCCALFVLELFLC
ncbi:AzlD domain-containing protein [Treponema sp.]|uniref:AzlD domain-containing protein n=1 Tax=Treponema sp. TaxID=166 RepID=UPI0025CDFB98|nr:AzlD domain-containing protein [Treponema sp.]MCR5218665.1 AzlD domain-containing protein [Treponema sp.]